MNVSRLSMPAAVLYFVLSSTASLAACSSAAAGDRMCGPRCLLAVCQRLGVQATLDELATLSHYDARAGTSMLNLQEAAKAKGLQAASMRIGIDELSSFSGWAIVYMWGGHFVAIEGGVSGKIVVIDPPAEPLAVAKKALQENYSGLALLIAKEASSLPKPHTDGPSLLLTAYDWSFGAVDEGDQPAHSFRCRNLGSANLVVSNVHTSCDGCLSVTDWPSTIPPGGQGEIKAVARTNGHQGEMRNYIYIASNDPTTPTAKIEVSGYVRPAKLLFDPQIVDLGKPRCDETVSTIILLPVSAEDGFIVQSVSSTSPYLGAVLSGGRDKPGYRITATLDPGAPVGHFTASITVVSTHPKQPKAEIPVTATIKGNIDLDRDCFFLGLAKQGKGAVSSVTISTVSKDPLKIGKIDNPLDCVTVEVRPKAEGKEYVLTATLKPDAPLGNIKGEVTVHTNDPDQPEIKIPVYAYVEQ